MTVASSTFRRDELRAFLRSRRARLSPAAVGLSDDGGRRRTPGLRREEVAALAGVGVSWYTWLEQGRDINPSPEVLDALAHALRLDPAERTTLFALARTELPLAAGATAGDPERPDEEVGQLIALVDALHPNPAYLLGPMTRILAWNRAASVVLGSPDHLAPDRRFLLWWLMADPGERGLTGQRAETARNTLARFRAEYARHAGERRVRGVPGAAARAQRAVQRVVGRARGDRGSARHQGDGASAPRLLRLHHAQTVPTGRPELRMAVYAPADAATRAALASL